jgi:hypothetical protein
MKIVSCGGCLWNTTWVMDDFPLLYRTSALVLEQCGGYNTDADPSATAEASCSLASLEDWVGRDELRERYDENQETGSSSDPFQALSSK